ncbi:methyl-accepting chemotaxis protein [Pseudomonas sp. L1(2025)]|uniref:methyl-accepting chemotaxis protein n=1 Tax=Pseudomonas sp. L1(2025) TaxID=3449429 RepID=UPI003F68F5CE
MNRFLDAKLSTKLISTFILCALITLAVGGLGSRGINLLSDSLKRVYTNNLLSVSKTNETKTATIAQNRDLFRLLDLWTHNGSDDAKREVLRSLKDNQVISERAYAVYRATPLANDERVAGEQMDKDWPAYQANVNHFLATLQSGDIEGAQVLLTNELQRGYEVLLEELNIMVGSNNRQIGEGAADADVQEHTANLYLLCGVVFAFMAAIALGLWITRLISAPINAAVDSAQRIASGDLTQRIQPGSSDETGQLLKALGNMQGSLKDTIEQIANASNQVARSAEELNAVTEESGRGLGRQHDEIQQAATAVTQMSAAVEEVARNAISTSQASEAANALAISGRDQAQEAVTAINNVNCEISASSLMVEDLAGQVREIGKVMEVIRSIADQTNLLALNAAIEAARAGEQGRGFAVVADEVRALAARTQASTVEIESMIGTVRNAAEQAVRAMTNSQSTTVKTQRLAEATGQSLERIAHNVSEINDRNLVIASASEEQANVAREVDRNLVNIQDLSTQTAAGAHQTSASSQELARLAVSFNELVARFKL